MNQQPLISDVESEKEYGTVDTYFVYRMIQFPLNPVELAQEGNVNLLFKYLEFIIGNGYVRLNKTELDDDTVEYYLMNIGFPEGHAKAIANAYRMHLRDCQEQILEGNDWYGMHQIQERLRLVNAEPLENDRMEK